MKERQGFLDKIKYKLTNRQIEINKEIKQLSNDKNTDRQVMDSADEAVSLSLEKLKNSIEQTEINELRLINAEGVPTVTKGKYVTIWRKQSDGLWKVVVDIANSDSPSAHVDTPDQQK